MTLVTGSQTHGGEGEVPEAHTTLACDGCHGSVREASGIQGGGGTIQPACRTCHTVQNQHGSGESHAFHNDPGRDCTDCHSFHEVQLVGIPGERFRIHFGQRSLQNLCLSCHRPDAPAPERHNGHEEAVAFFHSEDPELLTLSPSAACLICHSQSSGEDSRSVDAPKFQEHRSHVFGVVITYDQGDFAMPVRREIDPRIRLFDRRIECQTCHWAGGSKADLLVEFENPNDLCVGCHRKVGTLSEPMMAQGGR